MTDIYEVDLGEDGLYYVMGQFYPLCDPAYLVVKKGSSESTLYRVDMEDVHPVALGNSLTGLLDNVLSGE